jgi:hypothetical protein
MFAVRLRRSTTRRCLRTRLNRRLRMGVSPGQVAECERAQRGTCVRTAGPGIWCRTDARPGTASGTNDDANLAAFRAARISGDRGKALSALGSPYLAMAGNVGFRQADRPARFLRGRRSKRGEGNARWRHQGHHRERGGCNQQEHDHRMIGAALAQRDFRKPSIALTRPEVPVELFLDLVADIACGLSLNARSEAIVLLFPSDVAVSCPRISCVTHKSGKSGRNFNHEGSSRCGQGSR